MECYTTHLGGWQDIIFLLHIVAPDLKFLCACRAKTCPYWGMMKRAVKWTSTVDQVEKSRMVDVDQEKVCGVDVDRRRTTMNKMQ